MEYEIVNLEGKTIVGISEKTGNSDPRASEVIGGLWSRFIEEEVYKNIVEKKSEYPICLYSNYKNIDVSDEELEYDFTIGYDAPSEKNLNFISKVIPSGKYAKFLVRGNVSTAVSKAWSEIWQMDLERSYTGDFEEYLNESMDSAEIAIYVALK